MNKRELVSAAKKLGVEHAQDADAAAVRDLIQQKVDRTFDDLTEASGEDDTAAEHAFLVAAGELGFIPTEPVVVLEGEAVEESDEPAPAEPRAAPDEPDGADVPAEIADEVGQAIALREQALEPVTGLPTPSEFNAALAVANQMANTGFVPASYRGRPDDVFAAIMVGRELGLGFMTAMRDVHMIDGRPAIAAHRQLALMRRGGVVILESESTRERAWIKARRADTGEVMAVEFTMEEAKLIKRKGKFLVDGDNWISYPADMLWARCVGRLTRRLGPDLLNGLPAYVAEEAADFSGWGVSYGEGQELVLQEQRRQHDDLPEYRKEYPDYNWPASFAEIVERLGALLGPDEALEWLRQARVALHPGSSSIADLGMAERTVLGQKMAGVLADLDSNGSVHELAAGVRPVVQEAFAKKIGGTVLDGPEWSCDPDEAATRPSKDAVLAARAEAGDETPGAADAATGAEDAPEGTAWTDPSGVYVEDDSIPFGDPETAEELAAADKRQVDDAIAAVEAPRPGE